MTDKNDSKNFLNEKYETDERNERDEKEGIDLHGIAIEERVSLMKHIENLYQHAVQTQSVSKREEIALKKRAQETLTECARNKLEVQILDEKILDLKTSRKITEEN